MTSNPDPGSGFQEWLEGMHPKLSGFEDFVLPANIVHADGSREPFLRDYSRESLRQLEQLVLDRWPDIESFKRDNDTDFIDGAVRYIGESLLRAFGGGWSFSDAPGFAFAGRPFIQLDTLDRTPISPFNLITAALHRRTGEVLAKVYDGQTENIEERRAQEGPGWQPRREPIPGYDPDPQA